MPVIIVEGPVLDSLDKKRKLSRTLTDAAVAAYGIPKNSFLVLIKENADENIAFAGELMSDGD
jgi:4-oxalocrotonate tautomerase family enzyme